jgi:outer membrane protein assembly factor BamD
LAAHEVVVGQFYLKTGKYQAAINRLEGVFRSYPDYPDGAEVYYHLGQAYLLSGDRSRADAAFNHLFNGFPHSDYVADAEKLIRKNL